ncbi:hypothetical protein AF72_00785 [Xylella taiwanensis]|uniref:Uncharacterized protein n=1 Tax=Xylella taiwanensis TaxID=1444770 RepID=Z9JM17_9GAMM|nr:hypothetical protein AF72_00785 [Xylella taiwanensis]
MVSYASIARLDAYGSGLGAVGHGTPCQVMFCVAVTYG